MTKEFGRVRRSALVRAFDARAVDVRAQGVAAPVSLPRPPTPAVIVPRLRQMSVRAALEWAFATERVRLDFDDLRSDFARPGCDTIWLLMQRGALGCKVDGGGQSLRHDDAEVIASMVAALPVALGGRPMADRVARLAGSLSVPDWIVDARPRCLARGWRTTKHGTFAETERVGVVETVHRGRKVKHDVMCCPVDFHPKPAHVAAARRGYLDWWGALLHLQVEMRTYGLRTIDVTTDMPPLAPWRNKQAARPDLAVSAPSASMDCAKGLDGQNVSV